MKEFPVHIPEGAYSWGSQIVQYADVPHPLAAGISYFAGDLQDGQPPVDCLLYWVEREGFAADHPLHVGPCSLCGRAGWHEVACSKRLWIVGILNHYPADYYDRTPFFGPVLVEKAGNVNLWVRPSHQRQGIGTALWDEAVRRWDVSLDHQRFTSTGSRLATYLANREDQP